MKAVGIKKGQTREREPAIREIMGMMLKSAGHEITTAADGVEALEILDSDQEFDLESEVLNRS